VVSRQRFAPRTLRAKILIGTLPAAVLLVGGLVLVAVRQSTATERHAEYATAQRAAATAAERFGAQAGKNLTLARTLADMGAQTGQVTRAGLTAITHQIALSNPDADGFYVNYEPNVLGPDAKYRGGKDGSNADGRYMEYWDRLSGPLTFDPVASNATADAWYQTPKRTHRQFVNDPYVYNGELIASYLAPIMSKDGRFLGVGGVDMRLTSLTKQAQQIRFLHSGYAMIVTQGGMFVASPNDKLDGKTTLAAYAKGHKHAGAFSALTKLVAGGRPGHVSGRDPLTGRHSVFFYQPMPHTGWGTIVIAPSAELVANSDSLRSLLIWLGLAALVALGIVTIFVSFRVTRPLGALTTAASAIARGDLSNDVTVQTGDELGRTAAAFREMTAYLRETADAARTVADGDLTVAVASNGPQDELRNSFESMRERLRETVRAIADTSEQVAATSGQMAQTAEESAQAFAELARATSEIATGAEHQAAIVNRVRELSAHASGEAAQGNTVAADMGDAMGQLTGSTQRVTDVVKVISGFADQTHLLALNAAIEAARAGEHGHGFAVVADEVRRLAEETANSVDQVQKLVVEIRVAGDDAVDAVTTRATQSFSSIANAVDQVSAELEAAVATIRQSTAATEAASASTTQASANQQDIAMSAQMLADRAAELRELVGRFRI